ILIAVWPAPFVLRNAWQALRRGILKQDVLAASAAVGGRVGGVTGQNWLAWPGHDYVSATMFLLAFHCVGVFASILVHVCSSQSVRKLMDLQPEQATRLDANGQEEEISVDRLQQGDHVRVRPGQRIPIDGKVIQGSSAVDQQLVTGEPLPREINKD